MFWEDHIDDVVTELKTSRIETHIYNNLVLCTILLLNPEVELYDYDKEWEVNSSKKTETIKIESDENVPEAYIFSIPNTICKTSHKC